MKKDTSLSMYLCHHFRQVQLYAIANIGHDGDYMGSTPTSLEAGVEGGESLHQLVTVR